MDTPNKCGLNSNQIKCIAIIAMTIDHITWLLFPGCQKIWWVMGLHVIGRLTAPIMWFFIAEGFHYTKNVKKYILRLFIFAIISHFAYNFAGGRPFIPNGIFNMTSVMWSLAWSVVLMVIFTTEHFLQPMLPQELQLPLIKTAHLLSIITLIRSVTFRPELRPARNCLMKRNR